MEAKPAYDNEPNEENSTDHPHDISAELLDALPPPEQAPGLITAVLTDQIRENYFNALSEGREITSPVARAITYCLVAHAPLDASTHALAQFTASGAGTHDGLRAEYLPLYDHPSMPAEGKLLLDVLGTHLFHEEHPDTVVQTHRGSLTSYALDGGLLYADDPQEGRQAIAFQLPMGLSAQDTESLIPFLERNTRRYGDSFRAFLRLPGIDVTSPGLIPYFLRTRRPEDETNAIGAAGPRRSGGAMPDLEGVEIGGRLHVFSR